MRKQFLFLILLVFTGWPSHNSIIQAQNNSNAAEDWENQLWVNEKISSLTLKEQIAQLLMIRVYSNKDEVYARQLDEIVKKWQVGGVCFFQGGPVRQATLTNRWQNLSKLPMLVALDAEWGLGMRLDSCFSYPYQMTMGAMQNHETVKEAGREIGRQLNRLGVHINFAPVIDINSNPKNPVINYRSFGEDQHNVAEKGIAFVQGTHEAGVLATGKHFPGHGDTDSDSHYTLPLINHSRHEIYETDLFPFKAAMDAGLDAVMIAHLFIPALDKSKNTASTLSHKVVTDVLIKDLDFNGLIITDALDMKGVTQHFAPGDIEVKAFQAGNDILLLPQDVEKAVLALENAVKTGKIKAAEIETRCRKVLTYKYKAGLNHYNPVDTSNLYKEVNTVTNRLLARKIFRESVTIVKNTNNRIPLQGLDTLTIAVVNIGGNDQGFAARIQDYTKAVSFSLDPAASPEIRASLIQDLGKFNLIILSLNSVSHNPAKNYGITPEIRSLIKNISDLKKTVIDIFGNPYALAFIEDHPNIEGIVMSYDKNSDSQDISAQAIFGALPATGRLPVSVTEKYPVNSGLDTKANGSLRFVIPEEIGINSENLNRLDSIAISGISEKAYPGCQVMFAKDGAVFYRKSFGSADYEKNSRPVNEDDIYDIASLTKIISTVPALMKLNDEGLFSPEMKLVEMFPGLDTTNKANLTAREILTHQAGLQPWIRFYEKLLMDKKLNPLFISEKPTHAFSIQVATDLFISESWRDTIYQMIDNSELLPEKKYKYSDLGYFYFDNYIGIITRSALDKYVMNEFYKPLGLYRTGYLPINWYPPEKIMPTENDCTFRFRQVKGFVHDQACAMLGGVAGHAGVFSNSLGVAVMMQMFLQNGYYGGKQYISEANVQQYCRYQFADNRRGLGFDKPPCENKGDGPVCKTASTDSYGHSGFTGTFTWADPQNGLLFVFLSNRVYPDADNPKINTMNIRTKLHEEGYRVINLTR